MQHKKHTLRTVVVAAVLLGALGSTLQAQQRDTTRVRRGITRQDSIMAARALQGIGRNTSRAQVIERLRQSGMSRAQVRARLQQAGYDPGLADQYFDVIERGVEPPRGNAPSSFLAALSRIGIAVGDTITLESELAEQADTLVRDTLRPRRATPDTIEVFGVRLFDQAAAQFQPALLGPVDEGYRLGPGDEITLVLTGDVEDAYDLRVSREGVLVIPTVGQLTVNGLTLKQLEDRLYTVLGRVYSGVSRGGGATTRFQVSLGKLRTNQVFVLGDVARPAAYQVSGVATVLNALYQAGGPTTYGSFRDVEIWRGGTVIQHLDLYNYLLRGDSRADIRLEQNDRIFVPPAGAQVRVEGAVRRPAIYELLPGEGVRQLVEFAGGLRANAVARRIQIDRILPPGERKPGERPRVLRDVDLAALSEPNRDVPLNDGDVLTVFAVSDEQRNLVIVDGEVHNPGKYEWAPGLTLNQLIQRADGVGDRAYTPRVLIYRLNRADGTRSLLRTALESGSAHNDVALADQDSIVIFSRETLSTPHFVTIDGFVKYPDTYILADGMTLKDLVLLAGGFLEGAYTLEAEVSRLPDPLVRSDTTAIVRLVRLDNNSVRKSSESPTDVPAWYPEADEWVLQNGDRVIVRRAPGYGEVREVKVTGEVLKPGTYVLESRVEHLSDVLNRAGGLSKEAYAPGLRIARTGRLVAADLEDALKHPNSKNDIIMESGDSIHVPAYDPMVSVVGAVNFEARVLYRRGKPLDYYIQQAGGVTDIADKKRIAVSYPNGERATAHRVLLSKSMPGIQPGSTIFVPAKPQQEIAGTNWDQIISRSLTIVSTMLTAVLAIKQLK